MFSVEGGSRRSFELRADSPREVVNLRLKKCRLILAMGVSMCAALQPAPASTQDSRLRLPTIAASSAAAADWATTYAALEHPTLTEANPFLPGRATPGR